MYNLIYELLKRIKKQRPLIFNLTNTVTMDFIANGLLSLGASPIMGNAVNELPDLINIAHSVVINIGTLNDEFIELCYQACEIANQLGKPLILDPVGAGASQYRTQTCLHLLNHHKFSIIRGNASEIMALNSTTHTTKGVDTAIATSDALTTAQHLSKTHQAVVVISGQTDAVIQESQIELSDRGSALMRLITGSGCLLTAVISAFQAIYSNDFKAAMAAVTFYNVCGEIAAKKSHGPGSFKPYFLDSLSEFPARGNYEA